MGRVGMQSKTAAAGHAELAPAVRMVGARLAPGIEERVPLLLGQAGRGRSSMRCTVQVCRSGVGKSGDAIEGGCCGHAELAPAMPHGRANWRRA